MAICQSDSVSVGMVLLQRSSTRQTTAVTTECSGNNIHGSNVEAIKVTS